MLWCKLSRLKGSKICAGDESDFCISNCEICFRFRYSNLEIMDSIYVSNMLAGYISSSFICRGVNPCS